MRAALLLFLQDPGDLSKSIEGIRATRSRTTCAVNLMLSVVLQQSTGLDQCS